MRRRVVFMLFLFLCSGTLARVSNIESLHQISLEAQISEDPVLIENEHKRVLLQSSTTMLEDEKDVITPITTVPVINPSTTPSSYPTTTTPNYNPFPTPSSYPTTPSSYPTTPVMTPVTTPTYSSPTMVTPTTSSSGQSWCIASQTASQTALQVALDYACGFGGADCSAIQQGGSCFNPDTVRDHASYAFNNYYQKNPVATSCDFGGTAVITNVDPSTSTCQYPSSSSSSSVINATTNPTGSTVFGSVPPYSTTNDSTSMLNSMTLLITLMCFQMSLVWVNVNK